MRLGGSALLVLTTLAAAAACAAGPGGAPVPSATSPGPVTVPLEVLGSPPKLTVAVDVGGTALRVRVDTGSVGLRVLGARVPAGVARTVGPAPRIAYASGERLAGDVATASLRIGSVDSAGPVPIELVTSADCAPDRPRCSAAGGRTAGMFSGGVDGILGIRPSDDAGVPNPLWSFGDLGHAYVVHYDPAGASTLVLGAPADGFTAAHYPPSTTPGVEAAAGEPAWTARLPVCFTAPPRAAPLCTPTLFDTGTPALAVVSTPDGGGREVPAGSPVTYATPDGSWSAGYTTGPGSTAVIRPAAEQPAGSVAGLPAFAAVDVRVDLAAGTIGFRPR